LLYVFTSIIENNNYKKNVRIKKNDIHIFIIIIYFIFLKNFYYTFLLFIIIIIKLQFLTTREPIRTLRLIDLPAIQFDVYGRVFYIIKKGSDLRCHDILNTYILTVCRQDNFNAIR
jgi:hypothetical protein